MTDEETCGKETNYKGQSMINGVDRASTSYRARSKSSGTCWTPCLERTIWTSRSTGVLFEYVNEA